MSDALDPVEAWTQFWDYAARGEIRLPVCDDCGTANWYPSSRCRNCGSGNQTWRPLTGRGSTFLAMKVHRDFGGSQEEVPYDVALVVPEEHPSVRLVVRVDPASPSLAAGDAVSLRVGRAGDHDALFALAASGGAA